MDISADDGAVDRTRDEDNGQSNTEGDLGHEGASREQGGRLYALADEVVDQRARQGVDDDLDGSEHPDGLGEVLGRVHLVHEGELADGEAVGEDDVRDGDEGLDEARVRGGPGRPVRRHAGMGPLDARRNDGDADRDDDGREVDVT